MCCGQNRKLEHCVAEFLHSEIIEYSASWISHVELWTFFTVAVNRRRHALLCIAVHINHHGTFRPTLNICIRQTRSSDSVFPHAEGMQMFYTYHHLPTSHYPENFKKQKILSCKLILLKEFCFHVVAALTLTNSFRAWLNMLLLRNVKLRWLFIIFIWLN